MFGVDESRPRCRRRSCPEIYYMQTHGGSRWGWRSRNTSKVTARGSSKGALRKQGPVNSCSSEEVDQRGRERREAFQERRDLLVSADSAVFHTTMISWREYCTSTALHGVRYIVDEGRTKFERMFWMLAIAISLGCCTLQILKMYRKWDSSSVIVSFAEYSTPLWEVPFPAVTICPKAQPRQRHFNFTEVYYRFFPNDKCNLFDNSSDRSPEMYRIMESVGLLCDDHILENKGSDFINSSDLETLREAAPPMAEVIATCKWQGVFNENCTHKTGERFFTPVVLDAGLCYSFNILNNKELFTEEAVQYHEPSASPSAMHWDLETGYHSGSPVDAYPMRTLSAGTRSGLFLVLVGSKQDLDVLCRGPGLGFRMLLHNPAELPTSGHQQYIHVPFDQDVVVVVKPSMMTTSDGLRIYEPTRRLCYFPYERKLRFFQVYTQKNCELECSSNYTVKMCNCTAFYMPRSGDMPICGVGMNHCRQYVTDNILSKNVVTDGSEHGPHSECHCLPECNSLSYFAETSNENYDWKRAFEAHCTNLDAMGENVSLARVAIYFKDYQIITSRRKELVGLTDFLADVGGLLGLFSGFSIISLIEIAYYLCIRMWCNMHRHRETGLYNPGSGKPSV